MTIGKNNEAPAIYSVVSTIKRLLDHLKEAAFYQVKDLESIGAQLQYFRDTVERCRQDYDPALLMLLEARIDVCQHTLSELQEILSHLTPELAPVYEKLVSILRTLSSCNTRTKYPKKDVEDIKRQLQEIQANLPEITPTDESSIVERYTQKLKETANYGSISPQKLVTDLLERCLLWAKLIEQHPGYIDEKFRPTYEKLKSIRDNLESRSLLQAWSLRETDLYDYQRRLDRIDESRTADGNFLDAEGHPACLQTQRVSANDTRNTLLGY
jgi:prefoldin subunit 5